MAVTYRSVFVGSHEHTIDGKGRLILPSGFRSQLSDGAFVTPLDSCLAILPVEEFERMARRLEAEVSDGKVNVNALRSFSAQADLVVPDAQGRVRILSHLRATVGLERRVIVTGAIRRVEVWSPERWAEVSAAGTERLAEAITHGRGLGDV